MARHQELSAAARRTVRSKGNPLGLREQAVATAATLFPLPGLSFADAGSVQDFGFRNHGGP
jgi:hypothetical protein